MPMIKCPDCANSISSFASTCPHCGYPVAKAKAKAQTEAQLKKNTNNCCLIIFIIFFVPIAFVIFRAVSQPPPVKPEVFGNNEKTIEYINPTFSKVSLSDSPKGWLVDYTSRLLDTTAVMSFSDSSTTYLSMLGGKTRITFKRLKDSGGNIKSILISDYATLQDRDGKESRNLIFRIELSGKDLDRANWKDTDDWRAIDMAKVKFIHPVLFKSILASCTAKYDSQYLQRFCSNRNF